MNNSGAAAGRSATAFGAACVRALQTLSARKSVRYVLSLCGIGAWACAALKCVAREPAFGSISLVTAWPHAFGALGLSILGVAAVVSA